MELTPQFALLVPVIMGIVQVAKTSGLNSRYAPALSLLVGLAIAMGVDGVSVQSAIAGVVGGLIASGLWSGTKATLQ
jgi:hypothetical protein